MHNVPHIIPYKLSDLTVEQNALHYFRYGPHLLIWAHDDPLI
jgi:hypothetical protein